ncbi:hypothetical protein, partial [Enterococcus casseliflavus]|uniref:hypothetical protein n=1 Tax=Enterococcus casseliflavus TaxID=37734 RepID=UPI003D0A1DC7
TIVVDALTTSEPKIALPPDLFAVDHWYAIDVRSVHGGFTGAADGDLESFELPVSISRADSAVFQVVAP